VNGMDRQVRLTAEECVPLAAELASVGSHALFAVDDIDGALKVKIDGGTWSPPLGVILDRGIPIPGIRRSAYIQDDTPLIDPDCRDGKHTSYVGGPCECACHATSAGD
jgi:hypothetical protein